MIRELPFKMRLKVDRSMYDDAPMVYYRKTYGVPGSMLSIKVIANEGICGIKIAWLAGCSCCGQCKYAIICESPDEATTLKALRSLKCIEWLSAKAIPRTAVNTHERLLCVIGVDELRGVMSRYDAVETGEISPAVTLIVSKSYGMWRACDIADYDHDEGKLKITHQYYYEHTAFDAQDLALRPFAGGP